MWLVMVITMVMMMVMVMISGNDDGKINGNGDDKW